MQGLEAQIHIKSKRRNGWSLSEMTRDREIQQPHGDSQNTYLGRVPTMHNGGSHHPTAGSHVSIHAWKMASLRHPTHH